jgi:hypothetical protein
LSADEKGRVVWVLLAHSGLRPEVLGNYDGADGLRVKDLPEMEIRKTEVVFTKIPTLVRVRQSLSKKSHEYFTFLGSEVCEYHLNVAIYPTLEQLLGVESFHRLTGLEDP